MPADLLLTNVRPMGGETVDVLVLKGVIARLESGITPPAPDIPHEDGDNQLLLPGFVDGHAHIDKTLWGTPWHPHRAGPRLSDKIENERQLRRTMGLSPATQSARIVRQGISRGTTHIRTHVDIDTEIGLANFVGVCETREALRDVVDIQIVAFPQSGLLVRPGTVELIEEALRQGAEVVGGLDPAGFDHDPKGQLDTIFALAVKYGVEIDIHLHDPGELGALQIEMIADYTRAAGLQGRVAISHAFCLGDVDETRYQNLVERLVENRIRIMTHGPASRPFPPIASLRGAGVGLFSGSDGIRDTWGPYGNADMLERAWILSFRSNFRYDAQIALTLEMVTYGGAATVGATDYGLAVGCQADFVVVPGESPVEAIMMRPPRTLVMKRGRVITRAGICVV